MTDPHDGRPAGPATQQTAVRVAAAADAAEITSVFLASRAAAMPYLPKLHTDEETRWWIEHIVLTGHRVWVATDGEPGRVVGFAALDGELLAHLYLLPDVRRRGIGSVLLAVVRAASPDRLRLHVFQRNTAAVAFYRRHGFRLVATDDGSRNEEREPDATFEWVP
ncbi:GNAT family N-acetyltransferase [Dactylosporangium sp. NPDC048998]|uniref:GNAT family N-acetyltransferase n=1 Tax=Dactylosporangium sp. NPDC048998 TaxID=3363976 RepID=UPI00371CC598